MDKSNFAKGLLTVPAISTGVDLLTNSPIGETIGDVTTTVGTILNTGNSYLNPLFAVATGGVSAGMLTNSVLKDLGLEKKWLRYSLSGGATLVGLAGGSAIAPYLVAGGLSYAIGKHGWKYGKGALKRAGGTVWGLTGGVVKGAVVGGYKSAKAGIKGEQKINPVI